MSTYVKDLFERVAMTFVATLLAFIGAGPLDVLSFDWPTALSVSGSAAFLSLLKGLLARSTGPTDGAGLGT